MIRRPTLTFVLSYFFVATAALVLKVPAHSQNPGPAGSAPIGSQPGSSSTRQQALSPTASAPWSGGDDPFAHLASTTAASRVDRSQTGTPSTSTIPKDRSPRQPSSPFARGQAGETVAQAATRIYGDPRFAEELWLANRDSLPSQTATLDAPVLLRTPPITTRRAK